MKREPLSIEHLTATCRWSETLGVLACDMAGAVWATYGVSSKVGRLAETFQHAATDLWAPLEARVHERDEGVPTTTLRAPDEPSRPNRIARIRGALCQFHERLRPVRRDGELWQFGLGVYPPVGWFQGEVEIVAPRMGRPPAEKGGRLSMKSTNGVHNQSVDSNSAGLHMNGTGQPVVCDFPVASVDNEIAGLDEGEGQPLAAPTQYSRETLALRVWVERWVATGQSQRSAAGALGVSHQALRNYLSGARPVPEKVLHALAQHSNPPPAPRPHPSQEADDARV